MLEYLHMIPQRFNESLSCSGYGFSRNCQNSNINFIFFAPKHLTHYSFLPSLMLWLRSLGTGILVVIIARYIPTGFVNDYKSWFAYASIVGVISVMITLSVNIALDLSLFKEVCRQIRSVLAVQKAKRDS